MWVCGYSVNANTTYHVVATFNKATMRAKLYVAGAFVSESKPRETEATYSSYFSIGNNRSANNPVYPFQGAIMLNRDFDYELTAEEVMSLDHNGDPAGYIVPKSRRLQAPPYIRLMAPMTTDGWSPYNAQSIPPTIVDGALAVTYPTETGLGYNNGIWRPLSVNVENECYFLLKFKAKADDDNSRIVSFVGVSYGLLYYKHNVIASTSFTEYYAVFKNTMGMPMASIGFYPILNTSGNGKFYIKDVSVTSIGLIAEYLPQNLVVAHKRDFPQVVFPAGIYTPSSEVFRVNDPNVTISLSNQPQSNGFSGDFMRFESIKQISTYCAYWNSYLKKNAPIKITLEYRSNYAIYISQETTNAALAQKIGEANEAAPIAVSFVYGLGRSAFLLTTANINNGWLEIRVLSIEVAEDVCIGWLDSAKQLPLNDEYLPPLLETAGGYDLTANGTPETVYKTK